MPRGRALALSGALTVLCLTAAACGRGDGGDTSPSQTGGSEVVSAELSPSSNFMSTRPGAGILTVASTQTPTPRTVAGLVS